MSDYFDRLLTDKSQTAFPKPAGLENAVIIKESSSGSSPQIYTVIFSPSLPECRKVPKY